MYTESRIGAAVRECLNRCYLGQTPLSVMAEFLAELRDNGWRESDVQKIEKSVRHVLVGIVESTLQADAA